jgi:ribose 5-phosphate isomerase B
METKTRIVVSSDHLGISLRRAIAGHLEQRGCVVDDIGPQSEEMTDYPIWGEKAARAVQSGNARFGIVICGTGVGISLAANRVRDIRCVVCSEPYTAKLSRQHNDTNMLALGARVVGQGLALAIVDAFLDAEYEGGRHANRIAMLEAIEPTTKPL